MSKIETKVQLELTLEHHHGADRVPMEEIGKDDNQQYGKHAFSTAQTYICTKCGQRVSLDLVGMAQTFPPLDFEAVIADEAE